MALTGIGDGVLYDVSATNAGTGNYDSFLRIQNTGEENGFNTDTNGQLDNKDGIWTHSLPISELQVVNVGGIDYYEIRLDLNETNSGTGPNISLDHLQLYTGAAANSPGDLSGLTEIYSLQSPLALVDNNSGSGVDDYYFLIPVSIVTGGPDLTLYADFSGADGGFEEFRALSTTFTPQPEINIVKETDGTDNQCPNILVGSTVTWTYNVTNPGNVPLSNVVVTDDNGTPGNTADDFTATAVLSGGFNVGDTNHNGLLDTGETWQFTATGTATAGEYVNTGSVSGAWSSTGQSGTVTASEPDCYNGVTASISILKETDNTDNQCLNLITGSTVNWTYDVSNTGTAGINGASVVVTDNNGTPGNTADDFNPAPILDGSGYNTGDTNQNNILDPGETWHYSASGTVTAGEYTNTGTVNGTAFDDVNNTAPVTSNEGDCYNGETPTIDIVKETDGTDNQCLNLITGSPVTWTYDVSNNSDFTIAGNTITVTDDNGTPGVPGDDFNPAPVLDGSGYNTGDTNQNNILDPGETWHYSASGTVTAGEYTNTATVNGTATDVAGSTAPVQNSETDCYNGSTPSIDIVKETDGTDNLCPVVMVGDTVNWTYDVTNNSAFAITDVIVTDDNGTPGNTSDDFNPNPVLNGSGYNTGDTNQNNILDPGETWHYAASGTATLGHYVNVATVDGTATDQNGYTAPVTNSESDCYLGLEGACPRTPGFWAHWTDFWNGTPSVPKQAGQNDFPTQDLLYKVDSNHDGVINGNDQAGLLIGDYNHDGLTDNGEDTLFISYANAINLINASTKQMSDGVVKIGRDVVATWLNYLMGSPVGNASDPNSPAHFINDAVNYLQTFGDASSSNTYNPGETFDTYFAGHAAVKTSSTYWNSNIVGDSGAQIHSALDGYNNTGTINGIVYAPDCDNQQFLSSLHGYSIDGALFAA